MEEVKPNTEQEKQDSDKKKTKDEKETLEIDPNIRVKVENEKEFGKREPQLQLCKREGCPINREPMGASTEAAKLLKKHHTTCL